MQSEMRREDSFTCFSFSMSCKLPHFERLRFRILDKSVTDNIFWILDTILEFS